MYIKKLVMHGFKSFPKKTELPFTPGINVILGPNGSGKSNVSDALCFVLGRLSVKSMRAAKARNLIFLGTKIAAPAKEAMVELIFDNSDKTFSLEEREVSIKRIVRRNGQSIYKINNQTKTRQEVLALLAQAGIDPNGFNIVLQGEIQNFVRMHTEERRKVIEEVSGISIYEMRKEKSLKELNKTEEKLKEVLAVLRERTSYLNNLEKERQQALRFKKLEKDAKKFEASILNYDLNKKKKEKENLNLEISKKNNGINKIKKQKITLETEIINLESKVNSINSTIQKSTGLEQEKLNEEIANIRAELAGIDVKIESYENKLSTILKQKQELQETISNNSFSLKELQNESPTLEKNEKEIDAKEKQLEKLEERRKRFYTTKSELRSLRERIHDKNNVLQNYLGESDFLLNHLKSTSKELFDRNTDENKISSLKMSLAEKKEILENLNKTETELEKRSYANESEIDKQNNLISKISEMDVCPLCKNQITKEHIHSINNEILPRIELLKKEIENSDKNLGLIYKRREILKQEIEQITTEISKRELDLLKLLSINEKKQQIKTLQEKIENSKKEIFELEKNRKKLESTFDENSTIEQKYETLRIEVQEVSLRTKENVDSEISFKQRELERSKISLKQFIREEEDLNEELSIVKERLKEKEELLQKKKQQEEELSKKFEKLISERESLQKKIRDNELEISAKQNIIHNLEQEINNFKINKARIDAEFENLQTEILKFNNVEIIRTNRESLVQRLNKTKEILVRIGSVNLRSLEVYDSIKKEYDSINEKTEIITKEKEGIMKIIYEIDIKKKRAFIKTLTSLNETFSRNFAQLNTKGRVTLELENRKEPFKGGVNIIVKTGHGKYFDVKSLSGGEQTLVALSLIFAIQELNPYSFYLFDEIDAALDKRNSARLAGLLRKYMQKGQYLVITHNDEVITNATNLYGVSMHDGISKVISLEV
ncbi:chromosome segregation protein SMC [Candidatus Pacearchaeota archaeon]|nr:chromosome segregation protein SMC [Candidatus Pacearchaeota archaeon]